MSSFLLTWTTMLLSTFDPKKFNKRKEKKIENKSKIQRPKKLKRDIHKENLEDCPSWWWRTKVTSGKVGGPKSIKLATQFWLTKGPIHENIFIGGK